MAANKEQDCYCSIYVLTFIVLRGYTLINALYMGSMLIFYQYKNHKRICEVKTYLSIVAISLTASTPPGSGSKSMKKFFDSQIVMAFSCNSKATTDQR